MEKCGVKDGRRLIKRRGCLENVGEMVGDKDRESLGEKLRKDCKREEEAWGKIGTKIGGKV